jgi:large subunit ribosomal protein L3
MKSKEKFIIGKKVGMTQIYDKDGNQVPVTVIVAGPCLVTQKKTAANEGYDSVQLGFGEVKESKLNQAQRGHLKKHNVQKNIKTLKEFRVTDAGKFNEGDEVNVNTFVEGDVVDVTGVSIGKGFQGTVKRWNFNRGPMTHGSKEHRIPGSSGSGTHMGKVRKGKKMYGHMGDETTTVKKLQVVKIMAEDNLLMVKGAVPGKPGAMLTITR